MNHSIRPYKLTKNRPLNYSYFELLKTKIESGLVTIGENGEKGASQVSNTQKNTIKEVQEKVKLLLINAKVFDKALKSLTGNTFFFSNRVLFTMKLYFCLKF